MQDQGFSIKIGGGATWSWREPFRILTTLLLSLLLPLSFLLLARLSTARYISSNASSSNISTLFYPLLSLITVAAFVHGLKLGRLPFLINSHSQSPPPEPVISHVSLPRLYASWFLLCTLQVCVGLGIEGSTDAGVDGPRRLMSSSRERISWLSKLMFLLGLHETMHFWSRKVAKPVVDDTVMGFVVKEERWTERVGMGLSLGALWWWKLRDEVDSLVVVAELKGCSFGVADFVGWWLYYLTLTIGIIRVMKGGIWLGILIIRISLSHNSGSDRAGDHGQV